MSAGTKIPPAPWRYEGVPGYCGELIAADGTIICTFADEPKQQHAAHIVRCVNAHAELVAELAKAAEQLEGWVNWKCPKKHVPEHLEYIAGLRALLAKVTGSAA